MGELIIWGIVTGCGLGVLYGLFRVFRLATSFHLLFDILFWILSAFVVFSYMLVFNNGSVRALHLLMILLGFMLYSLTLGALFSRIEIAISKKIKIRLKKLRNSLKSFKKVLQNFSNIYYNKWQVKFKKNKNVNGDVNDGENEEA